MSELDLKLQLLDLSGGDVEKAKLMFGWISQEEPKAAEVAQITEGVILTDAEVMMTSPVGLRDIAMKRLAIKQNAPAIVLQAKQEIMTAQLAEEAERG